jgi:hypothetical protein
MIKGLIHKWEDRLMRRDTNRVTRPFDWGVEFLDPFVGLDERPAGGLGSNGSRRSDGARVFEFNERAINESEEFFGPAPPRDFSFDGHWLSFQSPVATPYPENNTVYARYFPVPSRGGEMGAAPSEAARARGRAVVVLPQWNSDLEGHVAVCRLLNRIGVAALRLSLPYHDRRKLPGFERADYMVSANIGRTLQACRQAVLDARAAIGWLAARGYDRIGIMGTSIGSCVSFLTFVHDERVRVGVFNHVSSYFGDVVWEGLSTAHVRRGLEGAITREDARRAWLAISPNSYIGKLVKNPRRGLLISARYDTTFTPELSRLLFNACDEHCVPFDRSIVPWGHYTMGVSPFKYYAGYLIASYFRRHL